MARLASSFFCPSVANVFVTCMGAQQTDGVDGSPFSISRRLPLKAAGLCHHHAGNPAAIRPSGAAQAADGDGTFRRVHLRALARRADVIDGREIRITGSNSALLLTLAAAETAGSAAPEVSSFVPKWRAMVDEDEYYVFAIAL